MKLEITKQEFMKSWQIAERTVNPRSTITSLTGILCRPATVETAVLLEATDLKTSVTCVVEGVRVIEEGETVFPVRIAGELFKKAPTDVFTVTIGDGTGYITAGRNRYRFSTYASKDFPKLPRADAAAPFCDIPALDLSRVLTEGSIAATVTDEFPKYLSACMLKVKEGRLLVVSTDGKRLSLAKAGVLASGEEADVLLPMSGLKELMRILATINPEFPVRILVDDSLVFFQMGSLEFSVRRVESSFPNYEKILNPDSTTTMEIDRTAVIAALERIDVMVREYNRMVVFKMDASGELHMSGRAPEIGEAREIMEAGITGEYIRIAFNVGFLLDGLKALQGEKAYMRFNGPLGQVCLVRQGEDSFLYMLMPIKLTDTDVAEIEESDGAAAPGEDDGREEESPEDDAE